MHLEPLLKHAPFDVDDLRSTLDAIHQMTDVDAAEVFRQTARELDRATVEIAMIDEDELNPNEQAAHDYAMEWLETARAKLHGSTN